MNMRNAATTQNHPVDHRELLARQGLRLPAVTLKHLRSAGIYCQPSISIEHQHLAKRYVLRGVESGGAVAELGAYSSFVDEQGAALSWLQRIDSIGVNGVHAIVVARVLVRVQMLRIERTYDLLITRHSLASSANQHTAAAREFDPLLWTQREPGDGALGKRCSLQRRSLPRFLQSERRASHLAG